MFVKLNLAKNAADFSKYQSGKSKLKSFYLRRERSSFFFFSPWFVNEIIANKLPQCSRRRKTVRQKVNIYKWTNVITMCVMLQINDVIKGTDETTETIMKSNAEKSKIFNDFVTSQN